MITLPAKVAVAAPVPEYSVWHRGLGDRHADAETLAHARLVAVTYSETTAAGRQVHVMRRTDAEHQQLVGWARDGVWHGAVA